MKHILTCGIALLLTQLVALQAADVNQAGVPASRSNIIVILYADTDE